MESQKATIWKNLCDLLGVVDADTICSCDRDALQGCGMTFKKADYIKDFVEKIKHKQFDIEVLNTLSDEEVIKELSAIPEMRDYAPKKLVARDQ